MRNIEREISTVNTMIEIYCRDNHRNQAEHPCPECRELMAYAERHTRACPRGESKGDCGSCTIHCYKPEMRERIRAAMRYSGPRMTLSHPVLTAYHLASKRKAHKAAQTEQQQKHETEAPKKQK
jgi:hypothetical protein